jgi:hypothetical protein
MSEENKHLRKQALIQAGLLPVSLPSALYSVSELFNTAASHSTYDQTCLWIAAALSTSVLALTIINFGRLIAAGISRSNLARPFPKFRNS